MRMFSIATILLIFGVSAQGEEPSIMALRVPLGVHIPGWNLQAQSVELSRQLEIPILINIGAKGNPLGSPFHFEQGSVRNLIEKFCKDRPLIISEWPECRSLRIEAKDESLRNSMSDLQHAFDLKKSLSESASSSGLNLVGELEFNTLLRELNDRKGYYSYSPLVLNASDRALPFCALIDDKDFRKISGLEILGRFFNSHRFSSIVFQTNRARGNDQGSATLWVNEFGGEISRLETEHIVKEIVEWSPDNPNHTLSFYWGELYRRYVINPKEVVKKFIEAGGVEKFESVCNLGGWDPFTLLDFCTELLQQCDKTGKLKILHSSPGIPPANELGEKGLEFWRKLMKSDDLEIQKEAKINLQIYEVLMKANQKKDK